MIFVDDDDEIVGGAGPSVPPAGGPAVVDDFETGSLKPEWVGDEIVNTTADGDTIEFNSSFRNLWWNASFGPDTNVAVDMPAQAATSCWLFARSDGNNRSAANGWGNHYGMAYENDGSEISIWQSIAGVIGTPLLHATTGLTDISAGGNVWFRVTGVGPVLLECLVDGVVVASFNATSNLITAAGYAGIGATSAGTKLDDFALGGAAVGGGGVGSGAGGPNPAIVDTFARATPGTNWVGPDVSWACYLNNDRFIIDNSNRTAAYGVSLASINQIGAVVFEPDGSTNEVRMLLRLNTPTTVDHYSNLGDYYVFYVKQNGSEVGIARRAGATYTLLDSESSGIPTFGTRPVLRCLAGASGALQLWVNDTKLLDITDGAPLVAGNYTGLSSQGLGVFDDFAVAAV